MGERLGSRHIRRHDIDCVENETKRSLRQVGGRWIDGPLDRRSAENNPDPLLTAGAFAYRVVLLSKSGVLVL